MKPEITNPPAPVMDAILIALVPDAVFLAEDEAP